MCKILGVARSGFYAWVRRPLSNRSIEDERLVKLIREAYTASDGVYGSPRVFLDLREAGERVGRKRVARLQEASPSCRHAVRDRTEPTSTSVHRRSAGLGLGDRHNIYPDMGGMALSGCCDGLAQSDDRGLVDAANACQRHRRRRTLDGGVETQAEGTSDRSLGSRLTVRKR